MRRYIRSDETSDFIRKNQNRPNGGYLYIFKHGIGPGTIPKDVSIIKTKDLPNYYTAVWLDRWLTTSELKKYDIPSESDIRYYLDRIGYCVADGRNDVVPCDGVQACDKITGATDITDEQVKFFYEHKFLGACDPENMHCDKLLDLMKSDKAVASEVLEYMNSLGDPVFPKEGTDYEAETDVDNVDIEGLYSVFMQELGYDYDDTKSMGYDFYVGGSYLLPGFEIFDGPVSEGVDLSASTKISATSGSKHTDLVNKIYSVMMNYEYGYDPDMTDINSMLQELTGMGVHVDNSNAFKEAWVSAHNKAERKTWGGSGDSMHYDSLTPGELNAIENYDTEYWEYAIAHPFKLEPKSAYDVSSSTKYGADMCSIGASADNVYYTEYDLESYNSGVFAGIVATFDNKYSAIDYAEDNPLPEGFYYRVVEIIRDSREPEPDNELERHSVWTNR